MTDGFADGFVQFSDRRVAGFPVLFVKLAIQLLQRAVRKVWREPLRHGVSCQNLSDGIDDIMAVFLMACQLFVMFRK
ncbi:hypothetical protein [Embleya sp. NPDC005575]|uniref:hypothetical protein n=1 Tax=Embleya sp. NPDC005575 TaxID=3156892 RepID=UPI0033A8C283